MKEYIGKTFILCQVLQIPCRFLFPAVIVQLKTRVPAQLANDFLMELFRAQVVDVKTMLENSSYPFAKRILEAIKRNEEQAANGAPMSGIPPELLSQLANQGGNGHTENV